MAKNHARWDTPPPQNAPKPKGPLVLCRFYSVQTLPPFPEVVKLPPLAGCSGGHSFVDRRFYNRPGLELEPQRELDLALRR